MKLNLTEPSGNDGTSALPALYNLPYDNEMMEPVCLKNLSPRKPIMLPHSNPDQVEFPLESLEEEFFFGDPAAWTFDNFELF